MIKRFALPKVRDHLLNAIYNKNTFFEAKN